MKGHTMSPHIIPEGAPNHADYPSADPNQFPRYIVSFYGGTNALVSKELYEAYAGVPSTHRYIQHIAFKGCNARLWHNDVLLPPFEDE